MALEGCSLGHLAAGRRLIEEVHSGDVLHMGHDLSLVLPLRELLVAVDGIAKHAQGMSHRGAGAFYGKLTAVAGACSVFGHGAGSDVGAGDVGDGSDGVAFGADDKPSGKESDAEASTSAEHKSNEMILNYSVEAK